jgi:hypothetical protein
MDVQKANSPLRTAYTHRPNHLYRFGGKEGAMDDQIPGPDEVTDAQLAALRADAFRAGNMQLATLCELAVAGHLEARRACACAIQCAAIIERAYERECVD